MARLGERCTPWVTTWLRSGSGELAIIARGNREEVGKEENG
ncbi:hypothetical protein [Thermostichus sp. MS-CIW-34]